MAWEEYESWLITEWSLLLNSERSRSEAPFQEFLELHPCLVPGAFSISTPSGHPPYLGSLVTQPRLAGNNTSVPDFLWLARDSASFNPVFIEIEQPSKLWFTKQELQRHQLSQASTQLFEWQEWFQREGHRTKFFEQFSIPNWLRDERTFEPQFLLIYGRRQEFLERPNLIPHRQRFKGPNRGSMTFDRIAPNFPYKNFVTTKVRNRRFEVQAVPPTLTLGPNSSKRWLFLCGVEEAIQRNDLIPQGRKDFLCERLEYWRKWERQGPHGFVNSRDVE